MCSLYTVVFLKQQYRDNTGSHINHGTYISSLFCVALLILFVLEFHYVVYHICTFKTEWDSEKGDSAAHNLYFVTVFVI